MNPYPPFCLYICTHLLYSASREHCTHTNTHHEYDIIIYILYTATQKCRQRRFLYFLSTAAYGFRTKKNRQDRLPTYGYIIIIYTYTPVAIVNYSIYFIKLLLYDTRKKYLSRSRVRNITIIYFAHNRYFLGHRYNLHII
jgi:hypothetical protein